MVVVQLRAGKANPKSSVVKHQTKPDAPFYSDDNRSRIMNVLSDHIYAFDVDAIANRTRLSKSTIMNIARGNTQWPRPHTLFILCGFFSLELELKSTLKAKPKSKN